MDDAFHAWVKPVTPQILVVTVPAKFSFEEVTGYIDALSRYEAAKDAQGRALAWVIDGSAVRGADAKSRKAYGDYQRSVKEMRLRICAGVALVAKNQLQRGIATAIHWLAPPVHPWATFVDVSDAVRWAGHALRDFSKGSDRS